MALAVAFDSAMEAHVGWSIDPDRVGEVVVRGSAATCDAFDHDDRRPGLGSPCAERLAEFVSVPVPDLPVSGATGDERGENLCVESRPPAGEVRPRHEVVDLDEWCVEGGRDLFGECALACPGRTVDADDADAVDSARRSNVANDPVDRVVSVVGRPGRFGRSGRFGRPGQSLLSSSSQPTDAGFVPLRQGGLCRYERREQLRPLRPQG